jgi:ribosomal protein S18 acetylase RimI-like enzyme
MRAVDRRAAAHLVRPATERDVAALADLCTRAFDDDPVANFMFRGPVRRRKGLRAFFTTQLRRQYLHLGQVRTTEELTGVAIWGPPDRPRHPIRELLLLAPAAPYLAGAHVVGALRLLFEIDARHPKEPHWYLATLATEPARQGTGVGSALLDHTLAAADEEGAPAYLESSKEKNVPLYARFGFEVVEEFRSPTGAPPIWRMWREPRVPETR